MAHRNKNPRNGRVEYHQRKARLASYLRMLDQWLRPGEPVEDRNEGSDLASGPSRRFASLGEQLLAIRDHVHGKGPDLRLFSPPAPVWPANLFSTYSEQFGSVVDVKTGEMRADVDPKDRQRARWWTLPSDAPEGLLRFCAETSLPDIVYEVPANYSEEIFRSAYEAGVLADRIKRDGTD
jgi:hypothetical protein